jgi:hypothetical protein
MTWKDSIKKNPNWRDGIKKEKPPKPTRVIDLSGIAELLKSVADGRDGEDGARGEKGDKGDQGEKGDRGDQGLRGEKGDQGIQGIQGEAGKDGVNGIDGKNGLDGNHGVEWFYFENSLEKDGKEGDFCIIKKSSNFYRFENGEWVLKGNFKGDTGTFVGSVESVFLGDFGGGGTQGLVPAPKAGDATKFLKGDGTWDTPSGGGGGSQSAIQFQDESVDLGVDGTVDTLDFTGAGVTASRVGNKVTVNVTSGGGGEVNTASNVGAGGVGVFKQKTGVDLEFKKINSGAGITITDDTVNNEIDISSNITQYTDALAKAAAVSDIAYNATSWDSVTDVAPSKNAVRDQVETMLTSIAGKQASGTYLATVEDEGTPLTQRTTMNFVGAGVSVSDTGGKTTVTIAGGAGDMVLASVQTVTGEKTFNDSKLKLAGATSGSTILRSNATAGASDMTLPTGTGILVSKDSTDFLQNKTFSYPIVFDTFSIVDQASDPATPAAGYKNLYGKAAGMFYRNSAGTVYQLVNLTEAQTLTNKTLTSPVINTPTGIVKGDVGLGNVDNTADVNKNVLSSTKLTTARNINGVAFDGTANITVFDSTKEPSITGTTAADFWSGAKTFLNFASTVLSTVLTGFVASTNTAIAATDTILQGLQKLQAQVTARKTDSMSTARLLGRSTAGTGVIEEITLGTNLSFTGTTLNATGGGGGGGATYGTATLDFGSGAGTNNVSVEVTGQAGILSGSNIMIWVQGNDSTASHNSYEHKILPSYVSLSADSVVAATGFTINAFTELRLTGTISVRWSWI